jgi:hypothetical protein
LPLEVAPLMTESQHNQDQEAAPAAAPSSSVARVPAKRLPWLWTILLLLILPAVGLGLWFGGTRHRVDDHPKKVKRLLRRLAPKSRRPAARPAAIPAARPAAMPAARPAAPPGAMR